MQPMEGRIVPDSLFKKSAENVEVLFIQSIFEQLDFVNKRKKIEQLIRKWKDPSKNERWQKAHHSTIYIQQLACHSEHVHIWHVK